MKEKPTSTVDVEYSGAIYRVKRFSKKELDIRFRKVVNFKKFVAFLGSPRFFIPHYYRELTVHEIHRMNLVKRPGFWRALERVEATGKKGQ